ncbi:MAG: hypothetical protein EA409_13100 [Saprospirales bacterium]|nr:MAG: hypothetical protein EA409_13100 [Saprospirales bacterium]
MKNFNIIILATTLIFYCQNLTGQCLEGDCLNGKGVMFVENSIDEFSYLNDDFNIGKFRERESLKELFLYAGYFRNGIAHGKGIIIYENGTMNYGYWVAGFQQGKAIFKNPDGTKLYCNIENGILQGESYLKDSSGNIISYLYWKDDELTYIEAASGYESPNQQRTISL